MDEEVVVVALTFDPFREMDRLASQLIGATTTATRAPRWMPMDLYRSGDHFVMNVDLPGVDPGSIDLQVDGNTLTVRAERTLHPEDAQWLAQERPAGTFMRQLNLGDGLDIDNIHASYEHGVLSLTIPVAEQAKPRRIAVDVKKDGASEAVGEAPLKGEVTAG
ncbi:Hsp20/alpha crystallin family protein [Kineosporiaceae bacterium SCSIO 59966]|nr:Hsp20/alpha crystallin family protein [Kineosporiaceae bacterium SCSIO 59966]